MKTLKRIIAVISILLVILLVSYIVFTAKNIESAEVFYEATKSCLC